MKNRSSLPLGGLAAGLLLLPGAVLADTGTQPRLVRRSAPLPTGIRLAWLELGDPDGEPAVMIHGYTDTSRSLLGTAEVINKRQEFLKLSREHAELDPLVTAWVAYEKLLADLAKAKQMVDAEADPELREMARDEVRQLEEQRTTSEQAIKILLLPKDPNDGKNAIVEIRGGTGGDEAALFAGDLYRMYTRYAERQGWKLEILNLSEAGQGGLKEVIVSITGQGAYSRLKYESGVHRVQRVPATEASGRIHTSTATVAVLPEADEIDIQINEKDLRIDTFCSSGPGGQSVNTTYSAVRVTHIPTGIVVSQQDEKSQIKNRQKAMKVLRSRLYEMEMRKQQEAIAKERRGQVGSGERSEKIRTYNFKENRITDHRINFTMHQLGAALEGDLDELINELEERTQADKLKQATATAASDGESDDE